MGCSEIELVYCVDEVYFELCVIFCEVVFVFFDFWYDVGVVDNEIDVIEICVDLVEYGGCVVIGDDVVDVGVDFVGVGSEFVELFLVLGDCCDLCFLGCEFLGKNGVDVV